jgi:hypothetical protein
MNRAQYVRACYYAEVLKIDSISTLYALIPPSRMLKVAADIERVDFLFDMAKRQP